MRSPGTPFARPRVGASRFIVQVAPHVSGEPARVILRIRPGSSATSASAARMTLASRQLGQRPHETLRPHGFLQPPDAALRSLAAPSTVLGSRPRRAAPAPAPAIDPSAHDFDRSLA